jgi:hypothetical protein
MPAIRATYSIPTREAIQCPRNGFANRTWAIFTTAIIRAETVPRSEGEKAGRGIRGKVISWWTCPILKFLISRSSFRSTTRRPSGIPENESMVTVFDSSWTGTG